MGLRRQSPPKVTDVVEYRSDTDVLERPQDMRSLVAAAAQLQLDQGSVLRARIGDEEWQREAWRHYDLCGELRFAANRHAGALSQCRLYVAELDDTGKPGKEVEDSDIQGIAESIFGGPAEKAEYLRQIDVQLYVGGESFNIAESTAAKNKHIWYVVTSAQIRREGTKYKVKRPTEHGGGYHLIDPKRDIMTRVWTPHPRDYDVSDSSVRSTLPILREIERLTLLTFSQIDSRLISAGLLLLPQNISFPKKDGTPGNVLNLLEMILEVASAQLSGAGTAAGLVPLLAEIPAGTGTDIQHVKFETALTAEIKDKLDHAIRRLATGLDIDPQELLGMGDSNHWSAWQIDENGIKLFIQPVMTRICAALSQAYLGPALKLRGKDPDNYTLWFDPSPLTVRPNRYEDAIQLYDRGEITGDELRRSGNFSDDTKMPAQELAAWRAWQLIKADPALLANAALAKLAGLPVVEPPAPPAPALPPGQEGAGPDGLQSAIDSLGGKAAQDGGRALPAKPNPTQQDGGKQQYAVILPGAEQVVLRALELAGGRMLDRHSRGRYGDVERFALHTHIRDIDRPRAEALLSGAFTHVPALAAHHGVPSGDLTFLLHEYCVELLMRGYAHSTELLREMLRRARG
jgi:hypothetical protein